MIDYFEQLMPDEQESITDVIQILFRQTFLLERKFDRRLGRMQYTHEYRVCSKHFEFLKMYFSVAGISLKENVHMGLIYIEGETLWGEKLPRLATIYLLILKLIYDEQMAAVSSSSHIVTTLGAMNGRAGEFRVLRTLPSPTEIRRTIALLKRYQVIEPLDVLEELNESTRLVIYPSIQAVLSGDDIRALLQTFSEKDERQERLETNSSEKLDDTVMNEGKEAKDIKAIKDISEITGGNTIGEDTGVSGAY